MTSTAIRNEKSILMDVGTKTSESQRANDVKGSFTDLLSKQTKQSSNPGKNDSVSDSMGKVQTSIQKNAQDRVQKEQSAAQSDVVDSQPSDLEGEISEALEKVGNDLIEEIAKELNMSEEEVLEIMEILGLTAMDLLQPNNLMMVVMQAANETDPLALVTNEELYSALKNLNDFAQEGMEQIQADFGISPDELEGMMNEFNMPKAEEVEIPEDVLTNGKQQQVEIEVAGVLEDLLNAKETIVEEVVIPEEETEDGSAGKKAETTLADGDESVTVTKETVTATTPKEENSNTQGEAPKGQENAFMQNLNGKNGVQTVAEPIVQMMNQPSTSEIMDQIMEFMKIQLKPEMNQLEMQLHPESLGTLQIHISSKEGVITAHFTAENESVKTALEGQMIQLRENFEAQGVKVEAIEVEIQSNAYQQQYESSKENGNSEEAAKKRNTHKIELNHLDELEEADLNEEEQIVVSMMKANGSTVDYKA